MCRAKLNLFDSFVCLEYTFGRGDFMSKIKIYVLRNRVNDKVYVGQTKNLQERLLQHLKESTLKQRGKMKLYRAIREIGKENFYIEEVDSCETKDEADEKEVFYIEKFDSIRNGYNSVSGGNGSAINSSSMRSKFLELYNSGKTYDELAKEFSVCNATIVRTAKRNNLKRMRKIPADFLLENKDKMTNVEIAKMFSVDPATVAREFKRIGIKRGKGCSNRLNPQNKRKIDYELILSEIGISKKEIAQKYGISYKWVCKIFKMAENKKLNDAKEKAKREESGQLSMFDD